MMVFGVLSSFLGKVAAAAHFSNGWGDQFLWYDLDNGLKEARKLNKPLMMVVHKMNCPACRHLKKRFIDMEKIKTLSDNFVLVNMRFSDMPNDSLYQPDGNYVPRIMFFTPNGYLMSDVKNIYRKEYQFAYSDPAFLVDSMTQAIGKNKPIPVQKK